MCGGQWACASRFERRFTVGIRAIKPTAVAQKMPVGAVFE